MLESSISKKRTQDILSDVFDALRPFSNSRGKVAFYEDVAIRLSTIANKTPAWGWRYVQGVEKGSVQPGRAFSHAITILAAGLDGVPAEIANTEIVKIHATPGNILSNSIVLGTSRSCLRPACPVYFVPLVPWQKYHSSQCRSQHYREKKS